MYKISLVLTLVNRQKISFSTWYQSILFFRFDSSSSNSSCRSSFLYLQAMTENPDPNSSTATSTPHFSGSSDHLSPVVSDSHTSFPLTVEQLQGKNYRVWAQSIKLLVDGKGKLGYLTGEVLKPTSTEVAAAQRWQSENSLVTAWLVNSMAPALKRTYMYLPTAKDVWDAVRETFRF